MARPRPGALGTVIMLLSGVSGDLRKNWWIAFHDAAQFAQFEVGDFHWAVLLTGFSVVSGLFKYNRESGLNREWSRLISSEAVLVGQRSSFECGVV